MSSIEAEFAKRFAAAWTSPAVDDLVALLHPEAVLHQPHLPTMRGRAAAHAEFQQLLRWLPDFHGEAFRSRGADGVVYIEWRMIFPIGRAGTSIGAVDRFVLQDGLGIERAVYFNQLPLLIAILTHPRVWPGFLKYRFGRR